jgi:hypothetical protein
MKYEVEVKVCGGGYEAVVTLSELTEMPTDEELGELKLAAVTAFPLWFGQGAKAETVAVCKRPVKESADPGRMSD